MGRHKIQIPAWGKGPGQMFNGLVLVVHWHLLVDLEGIQAHAFIHQVLVVSEHVQICHLLGIPMSPPEIISNHACLWPVQVGLVEVVVGTICL